MHRNGVLGCFVTAWVAICGRAVLTAGPVEPLYGLAQKEKGPFLDTLKELVSIESGSKDREALDRISASIADRQTFASCESPTLKGSSRKCGSGSQIISSPTRR